MQDVYAIKEERNLLRRARKNYSFLGLGSILFFVISEITATILVNFVYLAFPELYNYSWFSALLNFLCFYLFAFPFLYGTVCSLPSKKPKEHKIKARKWFLYLLIAITLMQIGSIVSSVLMAVKFVLTGSLPENGVNETILNSDLLSLFLSVCVVAPLMEELIFRKLFIDRTACFSEKASMVMSALCFAFMHQNFYQFFYAFLLGLLFAYVYIRTGRLRYSIMLHASINFMGGIIPALLTKIGSFPADFSDVTKLSPEELLRSFICLLPTYLWTFLLFSAGLTGLILMIVFWKKKFFLPAESQLPKGKGSVVLFNFGTVLFLLLFSAVILINLFFG